ncbi:MAG: MFS transporter [Planctomycetota bacterium]
MSAAEDSGRRRRLPPVVLGLGLVSLLTDAASEMVFPFLPELVKTLGGDKRALGLIEGLADAVAAFLRLVAGRLTDHSGRRRPFVLAGYSLSAVVRPCVALATATWHVLAVRVVDRVGKGLRGAPRDALIAAAVAPERRGEAFGFHRAMDHAGAVIGPILALLVLQFVTEDLRTLFWLAAIPGAFAIATAARHAREQAFPTAPPAKAERAPARALAGFLLPLSLFTLGRGNDVFLLALVSDDRGSLSELPLLWIGLHLVRSSTATLGGRLADRHGHVVAIALGWLVHVAAYGALAVTDDRLVVRALFLGYGLHAGLSEGAEKALVARIAPSRRWGAAFGWYHFAAGLVALLASLGFGALWDVQGRAVAFGTSAALAAVATMWLWVQRQRIGAPGL